MVYTEEQIKYNILKRHPDFDMSKYNPDMFSEENVRRYGIMFLIDNADMIDDEILKYGSLNSINKDTVQELFSNNFKIFCKNMKIGVKDFLKNERMRGNFLSALCVGNTFTNITNPKFYEFINSSFMSDNKASIIISFFCKNESLFDFVDLKNQQDIENLRRLYYMQSEYINVPINSKQDLVNLKKSRKDALINMVNNHPSYYDDYVKEKICNVLFGCESEVLFRQIDSMINISNSNLDSNEIKILNQISSLKNILDSENAKLINYINNVSDYDSVFIDRCIEKSKKVFFNDIVNHLTTIIKSPQINNLNGQPFNLAANQMYICSNAQTTDDDFNDYKKWDTVYNNDETLSVSLINDKYFSMVGNDKPIIGFNNIGPNDILDMGICDLNSKPYNYTQNINNHLSTPMDYNNFMKSSVNHNNEIVLKRIVNDHVRKPDSLINIDYGQGLNEEKKDMAKYFDVPIYNVDDKVYLNQMIDFLNYLTDKNDVQNYIIYLEKMIKSFSFHTDMIKDNYNYSNIENLINSTKNIASPIEKAKAIYALKQLRETCVVKDKFAFDQEIKKL